jgi:hypothetical protein
VTNGPGACVSDDSGTEVTATTLPGQTSPTTTDEPAPRWRFGGPTVCASGASRTVILQRSGAAHVPRRDTVATDGWGYDTARRLAHDRADLLVIGREPAPNADWLFGQKYGKPQDQRPHDQLVGRVLTPGNSPNGVAGALLERPYRRRVECPWDGR